MHIKITPRFKPVQTTKFKLQSGTLTLHEEGHIKIVRREDFDYDLLVAARKRGIVTQDG